MNINASIDALQRKCRKVGRDVMDTVAKGRWHNSRLPRMCSQCTAWPDSFMLHDDLWVGKLGFNKREIVCLSCVERHLGRPLALADFINAPINMPILVGYRIAHREQTNNNHHS